MSAGHTLELMDFHGPPGVVVPLESPYVAAAQRRSNRGLAARRSYGEGGSIPVVATFHDLLGVDTLLLGWGLDDDNTHSPNEKFCLNDFHRGIKASAPLMARIGAIEAWLAGRRERIALTPGRSASIDRVGPPPRWHRRATHPLRDGPARDHENLSEKLAPTMLDRRFVVENGGSRGTKLPAPRLTGRRPTFRAAGDTAQGETGRSR